MTTINNPYSFAQTQSDAGLSYLFGRELAIQLQDALDPLALGVVPLVGDVAGTGTDTLRTLSVGNIRYNVAMASLATETSAITPTDLTLEYASVSLGMYGFGRKETYKQQVLTRDRRILLDDLKMEMPDVWRSTFRGLITAAGAGFGTTIGSKASTLTVDDWLDLCAAYREALGSSDPHCWLHPVQVTQLLESARNEPAFQAAAATFQGQQRLEVGVQVMRDFLGLGIDIAMTDDVQTSGGGYDGFAHDRGGIGWIVGDTSRITPANPQGAIMVPEFGLLIEEITAGSTQAVRGYEARSFMGVAAANQSNVANFHTLRAVVSTT